MHISSSAVRSVSVGALLALAAEAGIAEPLTSWQTGAAKQAIVDFVARVTRTSSPDYVKPAERIAVFDNDGTLWAEQPVYFQLAFAMDRVKTLSVKLPEWTTMQPFKAVLEGDMAALTASGEHGVVQLLAATHTGIATDEFDAIVRAWLATAQHPKLGRRYTQLVYQPMLELLSYLRANGFKTFIVSGGGVEFIRTFAEETYGIPPEQVVGSSGVTTYRHGADGTPLLFKEPKVEFIDDGPGKPSGINRFIGRRPIFAFGNSDGDQQMLQWTAAGSGARFVALLRHTDAEREFAYDRNSHVGRLDKALDEAATRKWIVVDMKRDWLTIFPPPP
jgi:phosphoglycolate phosphatase-like HAD superfamily hydrolase